MRFAALSLAIAAMTGMVGDTSPRRAHEAAAGAGYSTATDLADWLVRGSAAVPRGAPRHRPARGRGRGEGRGAARAAAQRCRRSSRASPAEVFAVSLGRTRWKSRRSYGGTAPENVRQGKLAESWLAEGG